MNLLSSFRDSVNWLFCEVPGEASELNSLRLPKSSSVPVDVLVIDISGSMGNEDYPPSRLEGAKTASKGFLDKRRNAQPDAQVGLVTFEIAPAWCARLCRLARRCQQSEGQLRALTSPDRPIFRPA